VRILKKLLRAPEPEPQKPSAPGLHELIDHAEVGLLRKAATRYLVPKNLEASVARHERLGTPKVRKAVMSTFGEGTRPGDGGNYRLDRNLPRMDAETEFSLGNHFYAGSFYNEWTHGTIAAASAALVGLDILVQPLSWPTPVAGTSFAVNAALVALQRYNRARLLKDVDTRLKRGEEFKAGYRNWLNVDADALERMKAASAPKDEGSSSGAD